jgi:hypothetical protein
VVERLQSPEFKPQHDQPKEVRSATAVDICLSQFWGLKFRIEALVDSIFCDGLTSQEEMDQVSSHRDTTSIPETDSQPDPTLRTSRGPFSKSRHVGLELLHVNVVGDMQTLGLH